MTSTAGITVGTGVAGGFGVPHASPALLNPTATVNLAASGACVEVRANDTQISGVVRSDLVYFPAAPGILVPAWRQVTFTRTGADWYTVVDAADGTLLWRKNIRANASTQEARFSVYTQSDGDQPGASRSHRRHAGLGDAVSRHQPHHRQYVGGAEPNGEPQRLDP